MFRKAWPAIPLMFVLALPGCGDVHEAGQALPVAKVASYGSEYHGVRQPISIGQFDNRSTYLRGIFSGGTDMLGSQAKTLLETDLQQTNRFDVMDRDNLSQLRKENDWANRATAIRGARYVVTGDVTEFGRKEVGHNRFLSRQISQVAYAKVNLNIVDSATSQVVYSTQGAGNYELSTKEVLGFGYGSSYDSTLNGKVLDLAIREAVNRLVEAIDTRQWAPQ